MKERTYDLGGEATAETLPGGKMMIVSRGRGGLVLEADQVDALREALDSEQRQART